MGLCWRPEGDWVVNGEGVDDEGEVDETWGVGGGVVD